MAAALQRALNGSVCAVYQKDLIKLFMSNYLPSWDQAMEKYQTVKGLLTWLIAHLNK